MCTDLIGVNKEKEPLSGTAPERPLFDKSLIEHNIKSHNNNTKALILKD